MSKKSAKHRALHRKRRQQWQEARRQAKIMQTRGAK